MTHGEPVPFTMAVTEVGGVHHVRLSGEIDLAVGTTLRDRLVEIAGPAIDVDLSGVTFLDASGISALLAARNVLTRAGHAFRMRGARGLVRRVFLLMDLGALLDDEQAAPPPRRRPRWTTGPLPDQPYEREPSDAPGGRDGRRGPDLWRQAPALSESFLADLHDADWFRFGPEPYLVVDARLRIRAVNASYERATGQPRCTVVGERMFEAFPDNPSDPRADGVAKLRASMETVLSRGVRHWMGLQRYDVPDPVQRSQFIEKVWVPVNSPLMEDRRTVAVLHHVEDVTPLFGALGGPAAPNGRVRDLDATARALGRKYPFASHEAIVGALAHAHCVVLHVAGSAQPHYAAQLAALQLEVRFGQRSVHESN